MSPDEQGQPSADEQAIKALAEPMCSVLRGEGDYPCGYCIAEARNIWQRIDRAALRRALLADVRERVAGLATVRLTGAQLDEVGAATFYDWDEHDDWVSRAYVLALLGGDDAD